MKNENERKSTNIYIDDHIIMRLIWKLYRICPNQKEQIRRSVCVDPDFCLMLTLQGYEKVMWTQIEKFTLEMNIMLNDALPIDFILIRYVCSVSFYWTENRILILVCRRKIPKYFLWCCSRNEWSKIMNIFDVFIREVYIYRWKYEFNFG